MSGASAEAPPITKNKKKKKLRRYLFRRSVRSCSVEEDLQSLVVEDSQRDASSNEALAAAAIPVYPAPLHSNLHGEAASPCGVGLARRCKMFEEAWEALEGCRLQLDSITLTSPAPRTSASTRLMNDVTTTSADQRNEVISTGSKLNDVISAGGIKSNDVISTGTKWNDVIRSCEDPASPSEHSSAEAAAARERGVKAPDDARGAGGSGRRGRRRLRLVTRLGRRRKESSRGQFDVLVDEEMTDERQKKKKKVHAKRMAKTAGTRLWKGLRVGCKFLWSGLVLYAKPFGAMDFNMARAWEEKNEFDRTPR